MRKREGNSTRRAWLLGVAALAGLVASGAMTLRAAAQARPPHVVFVTGDDEYRSEITMPMIAAILEKRHGIRTSVAKATPIPQTKDNSPEGCGGRSTTTGASSGSGRRISSCGTTRLQRSSRRFARRLRRSIWRATWRPPWIAG